MSDLLAIGFVWLLCGGALILWCEAAIWGMGQKAILHRKLIVYSAFLLFGPIALVAAIWCEVKATSLGG